jgi:protein-tyrosine-phosphatase
MGGGDRGGCPLVKAGRYEEWDVPDPKAMEPEQFRQVRDLIDTTIRQLLAVL